MRAHRLSSYLIALVFCFIIQPLHAEQHAPSKYRLTHIHTFEPPEWSTAEFTLTDMNNKGEIVGTGYPGQDTVAFVWKRGQFHRLPLPISNRSWASGINDFSDEVGTYEDPSFQMRPFYVRRGQLVTPPEFPAAPDDINNRRQVIGYSPLPSLWHRGKLTSLELPPDSSNYFGGINNFGAVAGVSFASGTSFPILWWRNEAMLLPLPEGMDVASGRDINDWGQVAVDAFSRGRWQFRPYLWRQGEYAELPLPAAVFTSGSLNRINNRGEAVGQSWYVSTVTIAAATLWRGKAYDLNTLIARWDPLKAHVQLENALLVNDRGWIVVQGWDRRNSRNAYSYYLLTPVGK